MQHLSTVSSLWALKPFAIGFGFAEPSEGQPHRKSLTPPIDRGLFVKPIKQAFIRNPRLSPMTRVMLTLLAGWAGHGGPIETTLGILGRHLGRSGRQVQRYLRDAIEEGYLQLSYTKDRIGRITGLRLRLNREAIYCTTKSPRQPAVGATMGGGSGGVTASGTSDCKRGDRQQRQRGRLRDNRYCHTAVTKNNRTGSRAREWNHE